MTPHAVLEVDDVWKLYPRSGAATRARLQTALERGFWGLPAPIDKARENEIWGVRGVSLRVHRGEALGVIGLNGSGKTSLLRMIAGQIPPDRGEIRVVGRSASVIALTAGLQTSASGLDNIVLRSAMLGRSRAETEAKMDEIIAFTELGEAIKAPVATYSSGMTLRLAFAITVFTEPDLLVIDETLSVGDFRFRQKCLQKIRELRERTAFVFVSHSMGDISRFCDHAIVMKKGSIAFSGHPDAAIEFYKKDQEPDVPDTPELISKKVAGDRYHNEAIISDVQHYWADAKGAPIQTVDQGQALFFRCSFVLSRAPRQLIIGIPVWSEAGHLVTGLSTEIEPPNESMNCGGSHSYVLEAPACALNPGKYASNIGIMDGPEYLYRRPNGPFEVSESGGVHWGVVTLPHTWTRTS